MTGSGFCGVFDTSIILVLLLWLLIVEAVREVSFWVGWRYIEALEWSGARLQ
jgi:hypothetical protein